MGLFTDHKKENLEMLCQAMNGTLHSPSRLSVYMAKIPHRQYTIAVDYYTVSTGNVYYTVTRFRTLIATSKPWTLSIKKENLFTGIAKFFGHQEVEVGDDTFDEQFLIDSNDDSLPRKILSPTVKATLSTYPHGILSLKKKTKGFAKNPTERHQVLQYEIQKELKDLSDLERLTKLQMALLDALEENEYLDAEAVCETL